MNRRKKPIRRSRVGPLGQIESLEPRLPLAGVVSAALSPRGDLVIQGDAESNRLAITLEGEHIVVSGLDGDTMINQGAEARFDVALLQRSLRIDLAAGNDTLMMGGESHEESPAESSIPDDHSHDDEAADDEQTRLSIPGEVRINPGPGSDSVRISFVHILGDLTIHSSADEGADSDFDTVNIGRGPGFENEDHSHTDSVSQLLVMPTVDSDEHTDCGDEGPPADVKVDGDTRITTGDGNDALRLAFSSFGGDVRILTGAGSDFMVTGRGPIRGQQAGHGTSDGCNESTASPSHLPGQIGRPVDVRVAGDLTVNLGPDDDFALLRNTRIQNRVTLDAKEGRDAVGADNLRVVGDAVLRMGTGDDHLALWRSVFEDGLTIRTGAGRDIATLNAVTVEGAFNTEMGAFDDQLVIVHSLFRGPARLDGGPAQDQLAVVDTVFDRDSVCSSWEIDDDSIVHDVMGISQEIFGAYLQGH